MPTSNRMAEHVGAEHAGLRAGPAVKVHQVELDS